MDDPPGGAAVTPASPFSSPLRLGPFEVVPERWMKAEMVAQEVIREIQPTPSSEQKRRQVIDYIQRLIKKSIGVEVFPYGSVPLKTYLPDGDIDLTAVGGAYIEDKLAEEIKFVFEEEEKNLTSEFVVKDVQLIRAEVKLVKCIVQTIVVDVSLNQIGGLSTLCFLEQVDRLVGKDHLFKHSVILIKAWCYYESRILGAHHGLISTYALEIMVLYIFQFFHSTLDGPLAVLYKFLDYFCNFDWETYSVSLKGPVQLSSCAAVEAEMPEDNDGDLLLNGDFLNACGKLYSIPSKGGMVNSRGFQTKYLNIIDPLKKSNNLGRSVSKGNFYRIRSAFSFGALKLGRILLHPENGVTDELYKFFSNTIGRDGCGRIPDVRDLDLPLASDGLIIKKLSSEGQNMYINSIGDCITCSSELSKDVNEANKIISDGLRGEQTSTLTTPSDFRSILAGDQSLKLGESLYEDVNNLVTPCIKDLKISSDSVEGSALVTARPVFAPHLFFPKPESFCGGGKNGDLDKFDDREANGSYILPSGFKELKVSTEEYVDGEAIKSHDVLSALKPSDLSCNANWDDGSISGSVNPELSKSTFDFTGDYENYLYGLEYGRWYYEYASVVPPFHVPSPPTPAPSQFLGNGFSSGHPNSFHPNSTMYAMPHALLPAVAFGWDEMPKPRGTGTYFPNTNQPPQGYRPSTPKGRNQLPSNTHHNSGQNATFMDSNSRDRRCREAAHYQTTVDQSVKDRSTSNDQQLSPNGSFIELEPDGIDESGIHHASRAPMLERGKQQRAVSSSKSFPRMRSPRPASIKEQDRIPLGSIYHLKDDDDFPPLSV